MHTEYLISLASQLQFKKYELVTEYFSCTWFGERVLTIEENFAHNCYFSKLWYSEFQDYVELLHQNNT